MHRSTVGSGRLMYVREYYDEAKGQGERRESDGALDFEMSHNRSCVKVFFLVHGTSA